MSAENKKEHDIDLDELDELPDVVLGEKTRAMRMLRDEDGNVTDLEETAIVTPDENLEHTELIPERPVEEAEPRKKLSRVAMREKRTDDSTTNTNGNSDSLVSQEVVKDSSQESTDSFFEEGTSAVTMPQPKMEQIDHDDRAMYTSSVTEPVATRNDNAVIEDDVPMKSDSYQAIYEDTLEHRSKKKKSRHMKGSPLHLFIEIALVILIACLCYGLYHIYDSLQPVSTDSSVVEVTVDDGDTLKTVSTKLEGAGAVKDDQVAFLYARFKKYSDLKTGIHSIDTSWSLDQIFKELNTPAMGTNTASVTIVEGDWAKDIAKKFSEVTNVKAEDLIALWNNEDWIRSQMETYPFLTEDIFNENVRIYLEGYLAPDTYQVYKESTPEDLTKRLLDQSLVVYNQFKDDISKSGHSIHEVYTLASILQYEASTSEEDLKKVASVFYNRMAKGMPLQSSVTVCYAIDFDKDVDSWQACEMNSEYDSPYNTYKNTGLPPGAIENAGVAAIDAAIHPADTDYLYFMAAVYDDGKIYYANTLDEHNANVKKYLNGRE